MRAVLNIAIGHKHAWYHKGQQRLLNSLSKHNTFCLAGNRKKPLLRTPYEDKLQFISETGYTRFLWLDCSIQAIRPLDDIWNWIDEKGYYLYESGFNCAQSCNDNSLEFYGVTREEAVKIPEVATNVVGISLEHSVGRKFFNDWVKSLKSNANLGVKWPTEEQRLKEGEYPFLHHRQDQSTASLAAKGLRIEKHNHFVYRLESEEKMNESVIFTLKGGY